MIIFTKINELSRLTQLSLVLYLLKIKLTPLSMRYSLVLLCISLFLFSCKKNAVTEIEAGSFRISILPVKIEGFDNFNISGTLEIRHADQDVEYGVIAGTSENPTLENGTKFLIGNSRGSVDFTHNLTGLDTGKVYYVRAYALFKKKTEYSSAYLIGKMSPAIYTVDHILNPDGNFTVHSNMGNLSDKATIKIFLNNIPLEIKSIGTSLAGSVFVTKLPADLPVGKYTLKARVNNISMTYPTQLRFMEGRWNKMEDLPIEISATADAAHFIKGDWIYAYKPIFGNPSQSSQFFKYNYKTKATVQLAVFSKTYRLSGTTIIQQGSDIHFIGGDMVGVEKQLSGSKFHYVYHINSDRWTREADFPGKLRSRAVAIINGNKLFYGMGYTSNVEAPYNDAFYSDMWSYDLTSKIWTQVADFPQPKQRVLYSSFHIGSKLYLTSGMIRTSVTDRVVSRETWSYDTNMNQWSKKADYPGGGDMNNISFSLGNYAYVGMGQSSEYGNIGKIINFQFFKYIPDSDSWTEINSMSTTSSHIAISSPIIGTNGNQAIIGGGTDEDGRIIKSLYIFTP